jgi:hypothetical protein
VHGGIAVELCDQRQQIGLRDIGGQFVLERGHAGGLRLRVLAADIDFAGRVIADQHHGKARRELMLALDPGDFVRDAGAVVPIPDAGYGEIDRFFEARGYFNALFGCNTWTAAALRSAGLRTGLWNPLPQALRLSVAVYN